MSENGGPLLDVRELGPVERRLLELVRDRLRYGQMIYGAFDLSAKSWATEAAEELADGLVYVAARALAPMEMGTVDMPGGEQLD